MSGEPRIRDVYGQYRSGRLPFDAVVWAANQIVANYNAARLEHSAPHGRSDASRLWHLPRPLGRRRTDPTSS
jgi:hypothetical protein